MLLVAWYLAVVLVVPAVSSYPADVFVVPFLVLLRLAAVLAVLLVLPYLSVEAVGFTLVLLGLAAVCALFGQALLYLAVVLLYRAVARAAVFLLLFQVLADRQLFSWSFALCRSLWRSCAWRQSSRRFNIK